MVGEPAFSYGTMLLLSVAVPVPLPTPVATNTTPTVLAEAPMLVQLVLPTVRIV